MAGAFFNPYKLHAIVKAREVTEEVEQ